MQTSRLYHSMKWQMSHNSNHYEDREGLHPLSEQYCFPSWPSAAKLLVMSDFVRPHRQQPTRLHCPWDSPGKNTGVGCHFLLQCMKVKLLSRVWLFATPWTAAHQAPPSMGFSRQKYWSGVPLPSPPPSLRHPKSSLPALLTPLQTPSLIFFLTADYFACCIHRTSYKWNHSFSMKACFHSTSCFVNTSKITSFQTHISPGTLSY